jgi:hypothetical protein
VVVGKQKAQKSKTLLDNVKRMAELAAGIRSACDCDALLGIYDDAAKLQDIAGVVLAKLGWRECAMDDTFAFLKRIGTKVKAISDDLEAAVSEIQEEQKNK